MSKDDSERRPPVRPSAPSSEYGELQRLVDAVYAVNPSNSFVDPAEVEWTESAGGLVTDATHASKDMSHFGFLNKYSGNMDATMFIKNFKIMAYGVEETPTGIDELNTHKPCRKALRNGQLIIFRDGAEYNVLGQSIH